MPALQRSAATAEISLVQLKSCLVNLPSALVDVLLNTNTPVQNVVVELQYRQAKAGPGSSSHKSIYVGWTGMPAQTKSSAQAVRGTGTSVMTVEIDNAFAHTLGLLEGQKVAILLHGDPPIADTVNIEPLTTADWEIIELHANFLELNLLNQIRVLPNPSFTAAQPNNSHFIHPLTLHLSPTSTANIIVTALTPLPNSSSPFAKLSPNAEVVVAPKSRARNPQTAHEKDTSIWRSTSGKSSHGSTILQKNHRQHTESPLYLRAADRKLAGEWFTDDDCDLNRGFKIWVDRHVYFSSPLKGSEYVYVSIVQPTGLQPQIEPQQQLQQDDAEPKPEEKPKSILTARLSVWRNSIDRRHAILSTALCTSLQAEGIVGGLVKLEPSIPQVPASSLNRLKIFPFLLKSTKTNEPLKLGGSKYRTPQEIIKEHVIPLYDDKLSYYKGLWSGPITDGLILPPLNLDANLRTIWHGGLVKFEPVSKDRQDHESRGSSWFLGNGRNIKIDVQPGIPSPKGLQQSTDIAKDNIPTVPPHLLNVDTLVDQLIFYLTHSSSVLLTGGLGSGKTSVGHFVAHHLQKHHLYHVVSLSCRKLVSEEVRITTIKEALGKALLSAAWCSRGGKSLIFLDDLDKLCPVETELQVGNENGRSRQLSEIVTSLIRQYCAVDSGVVLLTTAQSKQSLNNIVIGGRVIREIMNLKAPDKDGRRSILKSFTETSTTNDQKGQSEQPPSTKSPNGSLEQDDHHSDSNDLPASELFQLDPKLDFLDIAAQTDGYMPGDLSLLVSRARNEALIRSIRQQADFQTSPSLICLNKEDFDKALQGFIPASLRNVTLHHSTASFDQIGGLHATRKALLETLQYPTMYSPIFAQCPLRLRSGLLLYGYPGCGKTLLASAVASECGLNFISVKGPEILNKYIGASEKSIRDLFERAEAAKPCVLFFDEFDSIAPKRGHDSTGVTDRVVNQLLTQMDGAEGLSGVYVLAATSRPDLIDPALLRPGRLDKSLFCGLPDYDERLEILHVLSKKLHFDERAYEKLQTVAKLCDGYSGADLQAIVYNAHLSAVHAILNEGDGNKNSSKDEHRSSVMNDDLAKLMHFRYDGKGQEDSGAPTTTRFKQAVLMNKMLRPAPAKLTRLDRRFRSRIPGSKRADASELSDERVSEKPIEVVIEWEHVESSLQSTRCSISSDEKRRLGSIYNEFVVGRSGKLPNGEGSTEIGGRITLM